VPDLAASREHAPSIIATRYSAVLHAPAGEAGPARHPSCHLPAMHLLSPPWGWTALPAMSPRPVTHRPRASDGAWLRGQSFCSHPSLLGELPSQASTPVPANTDWRAMPSHLDCRSAAFAPTAKAYQIGPAPSRTAPPCPTIRHPRSCQARYCTPHQPAAPRCYELALGAWWTRMDGWMTWAGRQGRHGRHAQRAATANGASCWSCRNKTPRPFMSRRATPQRSSRSRLASVASPTPPRSRTAPLLAHHQGPLAP